MVQQGELGLLGLACFAAGAIAPAQNVGVPFFFRRERMPLLAATAAGCSCSCRARQGMVPDIYSSIRKISILQATAVVPVFIQICRLFALDHSRLAFKAILVALCLLSPFLNLELQKKF